MVVSILTSFEITARDAVQQLQSCLKRLSQSSPPSLNGAVDGTIESFELIVQEVHITTKVYELLIQVLNHSLPTRTSLPNEDMAVSTSSSKWSRVEWSQCSFANHYTSNNFLPHHGGGICFFDDKAHLGATLAHRASTIVLMDSPDMIQCLATSRILEFESLQIW